VVALNFVDVTQDVGDTVSGPPHFVSCVEFEIGVAWWCSLSLTAQGSARWSKKPLWDG